ncbi:peptidoglycan bridge formation glycyltransferase FemA/FemB family protein [Candidatus Saccharibacteria bacterium]|nr:peptidoglycan bridge formation glycyltransferase FemA/FemB family protein [Candidatus Saccharibacteria bacterium]
MKIPITQSKAWHKLQQDLNETSFYETGSGYQYLAILKSTPVGKYLYLPYGPVFEDKAGYQNALKSLQHLAGKHQAIFTRVEPQSLEFVTHLPHSARKSTDLNPKETWVLDLTGKEEDLKSRLPSRLLRYYKAATSKGITITTSHNPDDIHYLLDLQKSLAKEKGINTFSEDYLKTELKQPFATLYLVEHQVAPDNVTWADDRPGGGPPLSDSKMGEEKVQQDPSSELPATGSVERKVIAAGLVFDTRSTRYNIQGAQNDEGRKLHATGILTIQLILDAKAKHQTTFDFWGIAPEGAPDTHPWAGFTNFKKTFAGREVIYSGTYDLVHHPGQYCLYKLLRKFNRLMRK